MIKGTYGCPFGSSAFLSLHFFLLTLAAAAQSEVPIGSWRMHLSYNNIRAVEVTREKVFAATESGLLIFQRDDQTLTTATKLNGLSSTGITSLKHDAPTDQLLIGYETGDLDIIQSGAAVINFRRLRDAEVTTAKAIHHISAQGHAAYLSTAYGVVLFDLQQLEIRETWRDLGAMGEGLPVYESAFMNDSIYLATANGVLAGNLSDNLLDYNNWERFNQGSFAGIIRSITSFNGKMYATGPSGLYRLGNDAWVREPFLDTLSVQALSATAGSLLMITDSSVWVLSASGQISKLPVDLPGPAVARQDEGGNFWVGDRSAGLVTDFSGSFAPLLPNGPSRAAVRRMAYENEKLYALAGGYSQSGTPLSIPGEVNVFENGRWATVHEPVGDLTDIAFVGNRRVLASFGSGLLVTDASGVSTVFDETNSPLRSTRPGRSDVVALAVSAHGLWVANYGGTEPLHLYRDDGTWESFSFSFPNQEHPAALAVDGDGRVWMVLAAATGGGLIVWDHDASRADYKTNATGSGNLPDLRVRCIAHDRSGYMWVGTDAGVAYFFSPDQDAVKPIYEGRFLLREESVTAIEVDGGNRKWIGTEHGVWLFNDTGELLLHHFTAENSPLLSDHIRDIEIHPTTGEVFFATDKGIVSYRSDATTAGPGFQPMKVFPNPVHPGFNGTVGISGLAENAFVRITDISGKLIWQTRANGGTATWNLRDQHGRRAATGVYLIFAAQEDGKESMVAKVAVIE